MAFGTQKTRTHILKNRRTRNESLFGGIIGLFFFENEQGKAVTVNGDCYRTTQPKLHSKFCALFLKIAISAAELMLFGHLWAAIWHRWTIICGLPPKISITSTSQRQVALQRTIFVKPLVKHSCTDRLGYCMESQGSRLNEIICHY